MWSSEISLSTGFSTTEYSSTVGEVTIDYLTGTTNSDLASANSVTIDTLSTDFATTEQSSTVDEAS